MRPIIGVVPLFDEKNGNLWMLKGYPEGIEEAGGLPLILPYTEDEEEMKEAAAICDGILLTGGHDIDPGMYGQKKSSLCGTACPVRDKMEMTLLEEAFLKDMPILGICRGIQMMNVFCGGTLYQDLPSELGMDVEHNMTAPYDRVIHRVTVLKDTPFADWFGCQEIGVNSYHHQGIQKLGSGLSVMARSSDGLPEAVYVPEKTFAVAVQWHPEFNYKVDMTSRILFKKFVESTREHKKSNDI